MSDLPPGFKLDDNAGLPPGFTLDPPPGERRGVPPHSGAGQDFAGAVGRIAGAAAEGYRNTPPVLTPEARQAVEAGGPVGRFVVSPMAQAGGAALGGMNALASGSMAGIAEGAAAMGAPALGRDVNQLLLLMPEVFRPAAMVRAATGLPEPSAPGPRFVGEYRDSGVALPGTTSLDRLTGAIRRVDDTAPPRPSRGVPEPEAGLSQPAGAQATPASQSGLTAAEAADYGSTADKQWLYKSQEPGVPDNTEYVPGIVPTMAQREQTVNQARATKTARNLSREAEQAERELLAEHNATRKDYFQQTAGSDVSQGIAIRAADEAIAKGLGDAWRAGGTVDAQPVMAAIEAELNAPAGKLPAVQAVLQKVSDALQKRDGSGLETSPQQVYGARRVINFLQSKHGLAENPAYGAGDVQAALIRVKEAIDGAIEPAAPGFREAIANYATAQRAIEAQEALQAAEPKLYDSQGRMQFIPFHRMMQDIVRSRDPNAPLNPWKSLTEEQMNRLKSVHDDLMRVASAEDLAKAKGSDTAPNMLDAAKQAMRGVPGTLAAGAVGAVLGGGPIGMGVGIAAKEGVGAMFTRRAERRATRDMQRLLRPGLPTRPNPLFRDEP